VEQSGSKPAGAVFTVGQSDVPSMDTVSDCPQVMSQRPTEGGEDSIDKNKQRITSPARTVATHIARPFLRHLIVQFALRTVSH
jgi:hypothetical protein